MATLAELTEALRIADEEGDKEGRSQIIKALRNRPDERDPADAARFAAPSLPMRAAKDTAQGLIEGTYGLARELGPAGPIGPVPQMLVPDAVRDKLKSFMPQTSDINKLLGIDVPPPADAAERYTDSAFKFAGGMLPGPAEKVGSLYGPIMKWLAPLAKREATGLTVGGIGQAAREISGQNKLPLPEVAGGPVSVRPDIAGSTAEILAGILPAMLMRRPSNVTRTLNPVLKDLPEDTIRDMAEKRDRAQAFLGKPVLLSQGAEQAGPLSGLNQKLATSEGGLQAQKMYAEQLAAAMGKAREFAESPTVPMALKTPSLAPLETGYEQANALTRVAKQAENAPNKLRRDTTEPMYDLANKEPLNPSVARSIINDLEAARRKDAMLLGTTASDAIKSAIKDLETAIAATRGTPATMKTVKGAPTMIAAIPPEPLSTGGVGRFAKEAALKKESLFDAGGDKSAAHAYDVINEIINNRLRGKGPGGAPIYPVWDAAQEKFAQMSGDVAKMKTSPMQTVFPQSMRESGMGDYDAWSRFLLNPTTGPDSIKNIAQNLRPMGSEAFPTMVKKAWMDTLDAASSKVGGINPELAPGTFANVIAGSPGSNARNRFHATVAENGMDKATADRMIEAFETISTGREGVGGIDPKWLAHAAGGNPISMVAQTPGLALASPSPAANAIRRVVERKTMERIVELFTEPKWVDEVVRISKYAQSKRDFQTALVGIMGYAGAHGGGPQQPKPEEVSAQLFK